MVAAQLEQRFISVITFVMLSWRTNSIMHFRCSRGVVDATSRPHAALDYDDDLARATSRIGMPYRASLGCSWRRDL